MVLQRERVTTRPINGKNILSLLVDLALGWWLIWWWEDEGVMMVVMAVMVVDWRFEVVLGDEKGR